MDIRAKSAGVFLEPLASEGDEIDIGAALYRINAGATAAAPAGAPAAAAAADNSAPATDAAAADAPAASSGPDTIEVVPPMGDSVTSGIVKEWTKQPGDAVAMDEIVCVIETGK